MWLRLQAADRRQRWVQQACIAIAIVLWLGPIGLYLAGVFRDRPSDAWWLMAATAAAGMLVGRAPLGWFGLTAAERAAGTPYRRQGLRRFRDFVFEGRWMNRLARGEQTRPLAESRQLLATWNERSRLFERIHWAWLALSVPAAVDAVKHDAGWFALYLAVANVPFNVMPVLLQRQTRARLEQRAKKAATRGRG